MDGRELWGQAEAAWMAFMTATFSEAFTVWRETLAGGNVGEFGESSIIHQTKCVLIINNLLADLLISQIFFLQMLEMSQFAKISPHQSFPPYSIYSTAVKFATDSHHRN